MSFIVVIYTKPLELFSRDQYFKLIIGTFHNHKGSTITKSTPANINEDDLNMIIKEANCEVTLIT